MVPLILLSELKTIKLKDLYWLAGLFEGEGSFMFTTPQIRLSGYPRISIQSADYDVIYRVHLIMNTTGITSLSPRRINGNPGRVLIYSTQLTKVKETIGWMMTLYSLMSERRQVKIKEVMKQWKESVDGRYKNPNGRWRKYKAKADRMAIRRKEYWAPKTESNKPFINPFLK